MTTHEEVGTVRLRDGVAVIDLVGDVNATAEATIESAWHEAVSLSPTAVVLGFERAGFINSTGIALIVGILARARARGLPVRAFGLTPHYRKIFEITRLADFLAIQADEDSAVHGAERELT